MAQQTAVEFLIEQLIPKAFATYDATTCNAIEQAKQMEKEQIVNAYTSWPKTISDDNGDFKLLSGEQYYNETYKKD